MTAPALELDGITTRFGDVAALASASLSVALKAAGDRRGRRRREESAGRAMPGAA